MIIKQYSILEFMDEMKKIEIEKYTNSKLWRLKKYSSRIINILSNEIFRLRDDEKNCKAIIEIDISDFNKKTNQGALKRSNIIDDILEGEDGFKNEDGWFIKIDPNTTIHITYEGSLLGYSEKIIGFPFLKTICNGKLKFIIRNRY